MDLFRDMLESMNDPRMRHAAFVHLPIALGLLGVLAALASATWARSRALRIVALAAFAILLASAFFATGSGEDARAKAGAPSEEVRALIHDHEEMGEKVWLFGLAAGVLVALGFLPKRPLALTASWLAVVAALAGSLWIGATAHRGGTLVYRHGVGPPKPPPPDLDTGDPRADFFLTTVKPILVEDCMGCHEEWEDEPPAAGLDLTTITGLLAGGESGPAVIPGNPEESLLFIAVTWEDPDLQMPKRDDKLTDEQIEAIRQWIRDGAVWR